MLEQCAHPDWLLPVRPLLKSGECRTSWLLRIANGLACSPTELLKLINGGQAFATGILRDLDLSFPGLPEALSMVTGQDCCPEDAPLRKSLQQNSWVLGIPRYVHGKRPHLPSRKRKTIYGYQFCPKCLASDRFYLQLEWCFSFVTVCRLHECALVSRCWDCGHAVDLSISRRGRAVPAGRNVIRSCWFCGADLAHPEGAQRRILNRKHTRYLLGVQAEHLELVKRLSSGGDPLLQSYFCALRWVLIQVSALPSTRSESSRFLGRFTALSAGVKYVQPFPCVDGKFYNLSLYSTIERARLLLMASALLDPWPEKLRQWRDDKTLGFEQLRWSDGKSSSFLSKEAGRHRLRSAKSRARGSSFAAHILSASE